MFQDFRGLFRGGPVAVLDDGPAQDTDREARRIAAADMAVFIGCESYKRFREILEAEIAANEPDPRGGSDVAACHTFKQQGLRTALRRLDDMVRLAQETIANG